MSRDQAQTVSFSSPPGFTPSGNSSAVQSSMFPSAVFGIVALLVVTAARFLQHRGQRRAKTQTKTVRSQLKKPSSPAKPAKHRGGKSAGRNLRLVNGGGKR